jgi:hypothetical protein
MERLVVRTDIWGGYYTTQDAAGNQTVCRMTWPRKQDRGKVQLTTAVIRQHFGARRPRDVIGLHTTSTDNLSKWGSLDLDAHGPGGTAPETTLQAALTWHDRLRGLGWHPLLEESSPGGSYHLWLILSEAIATPRLYHFLRQLTADHRRHGLPTRPEQFPKQPSIDQDRCGNWLRLPGRHHSREHWSRVWSGSRWLAGADAIAHILALAGDPLELVPEAPAATPPRPVRPPARPVPLTGDEDLSARAAAYIRRLPNLGEGQGRDDVAFRAACFLVRDLAIRDAYALGWLEQWDAGNRPPKGTKRLQEIIADAHRYGRSEYGCGLARGPIRDRRGHYILRSKR